MYKIYVENQNYEMIAYMDEMTNVQVNNKILRNWTVLLFDKPVGASYENIKYKRDWNAPDFW